MMDDPSPLPDGPSDAVTLVLCRSCAPAGAPVDPEPLAAALAAADLPRAVTLQLQDCLNACEAPAALAIQSRGGATYVFSGVGLPEDAADLIATIRLYMESPQGWIVDARPCGRMRERLRARVMATET